MQENIQSKALTIFVLPTQEDVAKFLSGGDPLNCLVREFSTDAELAAYKDGLDAIEDEFDEIDGLNVVGCAVTFTRPTDEEEDADITKIVFATETEALACRAGIDDAEGFHSPYVVEEGDDGYERLAEQSKSREWPMEYYVWYDEGCCDDKTEDVQQALQWRDELRAKGFDAYVADADHNVIESVADVRLPVLFDLDPETGEATGTVMPFCSNTCRDAAGGEQCPGFKKSAAGHSKVGDFGYDVHCEQCGKTIVPSGDVGRISGAE